jgi:ABC-type lipoprotein release transport system permease subunit
MIVGIALGICVAIAASRLVTALLYQVTATDISTYLCVVVALICTGVLATGVPAWQAVQADPLTDLHHE